MGIIATQTGLASDFINVAARNATPANDAGRVPKLESDGYLSRRFLGPRVAVRAYASATQAGVNTTPVKITFGTENFDATSNFASSTFTAPRAGYYMITSTLNILNISTADHLATVYVYKNGAEISRGVAFKSNTTEPGTAQIYDIVSLAASDTIEIYGTDTGNGTVQSGSNLSFVAITEL